VDTIAKRMGVVEVGEGEEGVDEVRHPRLEHDRYDTFSTIFRQRVGARGW
jgi:hypothetical protein